MFFRSSKFYFRRNSWSWYGFLYCQKVNQGYFMKQVTLSKKLFCRRCGKKLRNGISKYCLSCKKEIEREKRLKLQEKKANSPSVLKKACDILFSQVIRLRDGKCLKCGKTYNLQTAHLINRNNLLYRWDERNAITLCYADHILWAHRNPLEFQFWLNDNYPEKYQFWLTHRHTVNTEPLSYIDIKFKLERRLEELKNQR